MESKSKKCSRCATDKPLTAFHKGDSAGGRQSWCKACHTLRMRGWREKNRKRANELSRASQIRRRPKVLAYLREYYRKNRSRELAQAKQRNQALKDAAYRAYGGYRCVCCDETQPAFLSLDHLNNDGCRHRKSIGRGANIYTWLRDNGYPQGFQVLCHNCNHGKHINGGVCPHVEAQYGVRIVEI